MHWAPKEKIWTKPTYFLVRRVGLVVGVVPALVETIGSPDIGGAVLYQLITVASASLPACLFSSCPLNFRADFFPYDEN